MTKINDDTTKEKIDSLNHFTAEAKEKVWGLWRIFSNPKFLAGLMISGTDEGWFFHPSNTHEPGCTRPPELTQEKMRQDIADWMFHKIFSNIIQPADLEVLWAGGKTPLLMDYYLDNETSGYEELLGKYEAE
jgi:hypothetical protein